MPALLAHIKKSGSVASRSQPLTTSIIEYDCDILIPAAREQITHENAGTKAKIALKANGPRRTKPIAS
jgi:glutamate dehydrogenase/leucine dehydrogenase